MTPRNACVSILAAAMLLGCGDEDRIRVFDAPKDAEPAIPAAMPARTAPTERIVAAVVPREDHVWFFKLTGAREEMDAFLGELDAFLGSVRFVDEDPGIEYVAPESWQETDPGSFALAKWTVDDAGRTEMSITSLPFEQFGPALLLQNVNRWRRQVGLGPTDAPTLARESRAITVGGLDGTRVDLVAPPPADTPPSATGQRALRYDLPEGWTESPSGSSMRVATITLPADPPLEIAVTRFPGDVGGLLANVNRWRNQVGLRPVDAADLEEVIERIDAGGLEVVLTDARSDAARIVAASVPGDGETWFLKLQGPPERLDEHIEAFRSVVESVRLERGGGR